VFLIDGKTRSKKIIDIVEKTGKAHLVAASPAVGDLNGDGIPEIVVQSNVPQYISAIDITRFEVNWTYFVEPIPPAGLKHTSSPLITDINGDGLGDVIAFSANGMSYGLKGKTGYPAGELLWKSEIPDARRIIAAPALYDFDRNGLMDMVVGGENGNIYVLKSAPARKEIEVLANVQASNVPITASVALGDVNGDGMVEIVYSNITNAVQMLKTDIRTFKGNVLWPSYLGGALHAAASPREDVRPYILQLAGGLLLIVLYMGARMHLKKKKLSKRPRVMYL
jgi:hypothetical protein